MQKVELLAPAGDLEKLKFAVIYGADAVYIGGEIFGMRTSAKNFTIEQMKEGVEFAHEHNVKVYLTLNIIPHNEEINDLSDYLKEIKDVGLDALIISDPGVFNIVKSVLPEMEIHLSTQANNTNYMSANFWHSLGVQRIILARELSFAEIKEIVDKTDEDLEIEAFVHGAMCMSYSGRCLISNYLTGRDANKGECAHACRWKYHLVEEKRPGEYFPVEEDEHGTYFFNSKDLCMIEYIPELIQSGLSSLKIEGRAKSIYYVSNIIRVYRQAIDSYYADPDNYQFQSEWLDELKKVSYRHFTTGFYHQKADESSQNYESSTYTRNYDFIGVVLEYDPQTKLAKIEQRNRILQGDEIEIIGSSYTYHEQVVAEMYDEDMQIIEAAPHAQQLIYLKMTEAVKPYDILRKLRDEKR